jgi:predicted DCC family thiol-disulfide oxidoreductase YuxK
MRRPLLLYDSHCAFCRRWVARWRARTGDTVRYRPFRHRARAVQLIEPSGERYQGAEAVFRVLARDPRMRPVSWLARRPLVRDVAECLYRLIARHRRAAAVVDRLLFGKAAAPPTRRIVRWLFLRALGAVYLIAFTSLRAQLLGLYGSRGIEPIREQLASLRARVGRDAYRLAPSLLWLGASDRDLVRFCGAGQAAATALMLGFVPRAAVVACWALYLSFVAVGRDFLSFQWDVLLLETGLHAALPVPSAALLRALALRLHLESGLVKLRSGDPTWRACTACAYHYETQPLPTPVGWYAHHLPPAIQRASTGAALGLELGAPLLGIGPRRVRHLSFGLLAALQVLIAATGNFAFFNLLTMALELWLLDDEALARWPLLGRLRGPRAPFGGVWRALAGAAVCAPIAAASLTTIAAHLGERPLPAPLERFRRALEPLRSFNSYGLFAVMTTARPEIVIEGSDDGRDWRPYGFRYKPSGPRDPPRWVAPHQPRLDWQMWFAALGSPPRWFPRFLRRLLEGSPDVLALLATNPFPEHPPRYVRARLVELRATDLATHRRTGDWWRCEPVGTYFPECTLRSST